MKFRARENRGKIIHPIALESFRAPGKTAAIETFTEKIHEMRIREPPLAQPTTINSSPSQPYQSFRGRKVRCESYSSLYIIIVYLGKRVYRGKNNKQFKSSSSCFHFPVVKCWAWRVQPFPKPRGRFNPYLILSGEAGLRGSAGGPFTFT